MRKSTTKSHNYRYYGEARQRSRLLTVQVSQVNEANQENDFAISALVQALRRHTVTIFLDIRVVNICCHDDKSVVVFASITYPMSNQKLNKSV